MKVLHLCLACFYVDNYSYQENLLPKFHKIQGNEVEIIASQQSFDSDGQRTYLARKERVYQNENGIRVTRLAYRDRTLASKKLGLYRNLLAHLKTAEPDVLFIHGCQFLDMKYVVRYVKLSPNVRVFVDNHADYSNSATTWLSKIVLHRVLWKEMAQMISPYVEMFWGVLPARVDFLIENYKLPREKCGLLIMGADDGEIVRAQTPDSIAITKDRFGFSSRDFIIVTGGKIDAAKRQVLALMDAVIKMGDNVKLLILEPVSLELKADFNKRLYCNRISYISWASTSDSYDYFAVADLVSFPGRHSVYWEQAAAMGKPMLVKKWAGTTHVDFGGNVMYTEGDDAVSIEQSIRKICCDKKKFNSMRTVAALASDHFLYSTIAKKSLFGKS